MQVSTDDRFAGASPAFLFPSHENAKGENVAPETSPASNPESFFKKLQHFLSTPVNPIATAVRDQATSVSPALPVPPVGSTGLKSTEPPDSSCATAALVDGAGSLVSAAGVSKAISCLQTVAIGADVTSPAMGTSLPSQGAFPVAPTPLATNATNPTKVQPVALTQASTTVDKAISPPIAVRSVAANAALAPGSLAPAAADPKWVSAEAAEAPDAAKHGRTSGQQSDASDWGYDPGFPIAITALGSPAPPFEVANPFGIANNSIAGSVAILPLQAAPPSKSAKPEEADGPTDCEISVHMAENAHQALVRATSNGNEPHPAQHQVQKADLIHNGSLTDPDEAQAGRAVDIHLQLDPSQLGQCSIRLSGRADHVTGHVVVQHEATRVWFVNQVDGLRSRLESAGVTLGRFDVAQDGRRDSKYRPPEVDGEDPASGKTVARAQPVAASLGRITSVDVMA